MEHHSLSLLRDRRAVVETEIMELLKQITLDEDLLKKSHTERDNYISELSALDNAIAILEREFENVHKT